MTTFSTSREFAAPPSAVFAAIENPDRLARWWGPSGFTNVFEVFNFEAGGEWNFNMIGPDGTVYPNTSMFASITPNREVVIQHCCAPFFQLRITLTPSSTGTLLQWEQTFEDASVAAAVRHIVEPANEQNLDRLSAELGL